MPSDLPSTIPPTPGPETSVLVAPKPNGLVGVLAHWSQLPRSYADPIITTLDLSIPANAVRVQNAIDGDSPSIWDMPAGTLIEVTDLAFSYAEWTDKKTGEHKSGPIMTFIGPTSACHTGSEFAFRALQRIATLRGAPPWNPPLILATKTGISRDKNEYQTLLLRE